MNGKDKNIINDLIYKMNMASKDLNYERAANLRDKIRSLEKTNYNFNDVYKNIKEADIFSVARISNNIAVEVTFCRNNQNFGSNTHFIESKIEDNLKIILQKFIVQFYNTQSIPKDIIISHDVYQRELLKKAFFKVKKQSSNFFST